MPKRIRGQFGRKLTYLRQWREHRRLSLEQASSRFEMSVSQLSRIETGKQPYTQDFLELAADVYQTDEASLLNRDPTSPTALWSIWDQAKPGERAQIEDVVRALVRKRA